jgi:hypothetical protein
MAELNDLRGGDTIPRRGYGGAIARLIIVVTDVLGAVLQESHTVDGLTWPLRQTIALD